MVVQTKGYHLTALSYLIMHANNEKLDVLTEAIELLVSNGANPLNAQNIWSPIIVAIKFYKDPRPLLELFINKYNANPNVTTTDEQKLDEATGCLLTAISNASYESIDVLLELGADINFLFAYGERKIYMSNPPLIELVIQNPSGFGEKEMVKYYKKFVHAGALMDLNEVHNTYINFADTHNISNLTFPRFDDPYSTFLREQARYFKDRFAGELANDLKDGMSKEMMSRLNMIIDVVIFTIYIGFTEDAQDYEFEEFNNTFFKEFKKNTHLFGW